MCGIIGYTGKKQAAEILLRGLGALEYRGYDSAGISVTGEQGIVTVKRPGRVAQLCSEVEARGGVEGCCGIGHTRWATHGMPSEVNSHPQISEDLVLVHNGIIENYADLRKFLSDNGYSFYSQTDTEVIPNLIHFYF